MFVTLSGIERDTSPVQPLNALPPMLNTLAGIVSEVRFAQFWNARPAIPFVVPFNARAVFCGMSPLYVYAILPA